MITIAEHKGKWYKRVGKCNGCGGCCSPRTLAWDEQGKKMLKVYFDTKTPCPDYDSTKKLRKCKCYNTRPKACRNFPEHPLQTRFLKKNKIKCSYSWVEIPKPKKRKK